VRIPWRRLTKDASRAQEETFDWLREHRDRLWRSAWRIAWIVEDEETRRSAERWLTLVGIACFAAR